MIYQLQTGTPDDIAAKFERLDGVHMTTIAGERFVLTHGAYPLPNLNGLQQYISRTVETDSDIQFASRQFQSEKRTIRVGDVVFGGNTNNTLLIGGPCAVESEEQIMEAARFMKAQGVKVFRAGSFKPRTSPYTFQGLGVEGLRLLEAVRKEFGLKIITEVKDATHVDLVAETADIVQVGAKAMYDQGILRTCSQLDKPVLIKRHFGATIQEWIQAAEFVLLGGNEQVILCERGIRTFETKTRFTLDITGVAWVQHHTNLPIIVDPSHALGATYGILNLSRAALAMGADGLLIEAHPNPKVALSDAKQQLPLPEFAKLRKELSELATTLGRTLL